MTKQDYIVLAKIIKDNTWNNDYDNEINRFEISRDPFLNDLCKYLKADNPRFDEDKLRKACE